MQGKVMYDVFLYSTKAGYLLEFDSRPSEAPPLLSYLKRHVLRSKVKIHDVTDEYDIWAAWGSSKDNSWETTRKWDWATSGSGGVEPSWDHSIECPWGTDVCAIHDRRAVGMGRRLLVRKGEKPQDISSHDVGSTDDYHLHRILHGVPEGTVDIPPMHAFPMESNLDAMGGLDFRKGCYVGQELTVRTFHRGVVRKRILPIYLERPISDRLALPAYADIKPSLIPKPGVEKTGTRPRGTGKLLSVQKEVGLALLRLEHVAGIQKGEIKLELEIPTEGDQQAFCPVIPFWPEWWPGDPPSKGHSTDSK